MPSVGWCDNCNVPVLDALDCGICNSPSRKLRLSKAELKPIFGEEKKLYEKILSSHFNGACGRVFPDGMCFYNIMGEVIIEGKKIFRPSVDKKTRKWTVKFFKPFSEEIPILKGSDLRKTLRANQYILERKEKEAIRFLKTTFEEFRHLPLAVSFSGGKDSAVALALTRSITKSVDVIFLNTTIEFDETVDYVHELTRLWEANLLEVDPPQDFLSLCEQLGPPSTRMKWCCKTQKFSPQNQVINERYPEGVLVVNGIRKSESNIRHKFARAQINKMIPKQFLAFPILEWSSLDVWLYTFWRKIPYNMMYNYGFARIGCWACPEKSLRDFKLIENARPHLIEKRNEILREYAQSINMQDVKKWIESGKWRFRKTKWTKTSVCSSSRLCSTGDEITYTFSNPSLMSRVKEFMKVFGEPTSTPFMTKVTHSKIEISIIGNRMRVQVREPGILAIFERQLRRAMNCVGCGACVGICDANALEVRHGILKVGDTCTHCLRCITSNGIRMSCVSVNYKPHILTVT
jgi:phosphoadenosine phosphosulfate reductase